MIPGYDYHNETDRIKQSVFEDPNPGPIKGNPWLASRLGNREQQEQPEDEDEEESSGPSRARGRKNGKKKGKGSKGGKGGAGKAEAGGEEEGGEEEVDGAELDRREIAQMEKIMANDPGWVAFSISTAKWVPFAVDPEMQRAFADNSYVGTNDETVARWMHRAETSVIHWIIHRVIEKEKRADLFRALGRGWIFILLVRNQKRFKRGSSSTRASALSEHSAPSCSPGGSQRSGRAHTDPRARPEQLGGLPWPRQRASACSQDADLALATTRWWFEGVDRVLRNHQFDIMCLKLEGEGIEKRARGCSEAARPPPARPALGAPRLERAREACRPGAGLRPLSCRGRRPAARRRRGAARCRYTRGYMCQSEIVFMMKGLVPHSNCPIICIMKMAHQPVENALHVV